MSLEKDAIVKNFLILCEGVDEVNFIIYLLNSNASYKINSRFAEDIQVLNFGGINNLSNYLRTLQGMEGYEQVENILIIRDAEKNAKSAFESIKTSLKQSGYDSPDTLMRWTDDNPSVGVLLFPTLNDIFENGTLEDLCFTVLKPNEKEITTELVDNFLNSVEIKRSISFPRKFKNRIHTILSSNDEYVSMKIGEAAKAGAFDWTNDAFSGFFSFLNQKCS